MHDIPQPILRVPQFDLIAQILPIQVRVFAHDPGQSFYEPNIQIFLHYRTKHDASRILGSPPDTCANLG